MSVASQLEQLETDITNAYSAINTKGGTIPAYKNTNNLATAISSIPSGGGGQQDIYRATTLQGLPNIANEGDLGVVYYNTTANPGENDTFYTVSFPEEVVFESEIEYIDGSLTDNNYESRLSISGDTYFVMVDIMDGENYYQIQYVSNDCLTYTLDNPQITTHTFSNEMHWEMYTEEASKFLLIGGAGFDGLYSYDNGWNLAETQYTATAGDLLDGKTSYSNTGAITGTLGNTVSTACNDTPALVYTNTLLAYDSANAITTKPTSDVIILPTKLDGSPLYDATSIGGANYCVSDSKLVAVQALKTTGITSTSSMFAFCHSLIYVCDFDTSSCTNMMSMFRDCFLLETIPEFDTSNVDKFTYMCLACKALKNFPELDASSATNADAFTNMFGGCTNLTNDSINNILGMLASATSYTGTKTFKILFNNNNYSQYYPANTIQSLANYSAFTSAGWTIGW